MNTVLPWFISNYFYYFAGDGTQGLIHARQAAPSDQNEFSLYLISGIAVN
jgi:hypothetical protein